ncbi:MAG TPA: efflux RND transporter periplasmic adaptor subunit [Candidatus Binataceae bacterium]|nr:efflux RND transporter periplasmic adaptor subunit [Candidatus Binataceae bacterium]
MKPRVTLAIGAISAIIALSSTAQGGQERLLKIAASSQAGREITLAPVRLKPISKRIAATAMIEPDAGAVADIASVIPARVVKLLAQPGQNLNQGEAIAILSSVELGQVKTDYLRARSLEAITSQHLRREQDLYAKKITPMKDLLEARARHDAARAEYQAAREKLRLLIPATELNSLQWSGNGHPLSEFPLSSPIAGTLVRRNLRIGEMVDRSGPAPIRVINLDRVWVMANVFERDLEGLRVGAPAQVSVEAYPTVAFAGRVAYIGDEVDLATRAVRARIEVPNSDHMLKPGMFAHASIDSQNSQEVLAAPESAVYQVGGEEVVFVPAAAGAFSVRPVKIGRRGEGVVEIVSGLKPGEQVVAKGGLALKTLIANKAAD